MIKKIVKFIKEKELLKENQKVIVGVSGGADSVCLLLVLLGLRNELQCEVIPVHINHGLRGQESDRDEMFVRELCAKHKLELLVKKVDVMAYKVAHKLSEEEAGRNIRREVLEEVSEKLNGDIMALGHHRDDDVETALMHMARGSGLTGVSGMEPKVGAYIRPLLCVNRREIEDFLSEKGQEYCIDSTNLGNDYTRNRVRNKLLPLMRSEVNERASENIANLLDDLKDIKKLVAAKIEVVFPEVVEVQSYGCVIRQLELEEHELFIQREIIKRAIYSQCNAQKDIGRTHIQSILELCKLQVGREISLPHDLLAKRVYGGIEIRKINDWVIEEKFTCIELRINGQTVVNENLVIETTVMEYNGLENVEDNHYTKYFDYDIIKDKLFVDRIDVKNYITINEQGGRQSLKKFCTNQKIASHLRKEVLNIRTNSQVLWIIDYRRSLEAKLTEQTKKILKIQIGGQEHGRKN